MRRVTFYGLLVISLALAAAVGVVKDGHLCVGYESHIGYGVALYEIKADGALDGVFGLPGFKDTGSEKFYPEKGTNAEGEVGE